MATRSFIARYNPDTNDYTAIYCHWDGYPEGVGVTLRDHYTTDNKVQELIALGDISSLGDTLKETESYKMRGDTDTDSRTFNSREGMLGHYRDCWCEYGYIWENGGCWTCVDLSAREINLYDIKETQNV
jgi:hypothetical protein